MTPTLYLRGAVPDDADTILRWRRETAARLMTLHGTDQWSTPFPREKIVAWIDQGATVMAALEPGGPAVGTITTSPHGDPSLWTPEELAVPARYVFKANVAPGLGGRGIGACLITWTQTRAAKAGADVVRIDVWSTNHQLQEYYRRAGFTYLRTVPGTNSGALFEAPATITPDLPIVESDDVRVA
ncbi:Ribosomal protein S18 acetylase RimI [Parafrankia irregularis]|uniref:Ribosomal protein S18 acetylase RimI n=1 Tax=Parafrankia irregularis TaxID=795642 RepID=A0A0S4R1P2_9ACTN|nr:GNAT family N-acetyltransferase [Parafrankia irregularis]CUU60822.1 Ribosomal protein S18 acetylase RimI [Parafrankia irregularis]